MITESVPVTNSVGLLEGSIFIVTKSRENVKLGLVNVIAFDEDRFENYLEKAQREAAVGASNRIEAIRDLQWDEAAKDIERTKLDKEIADLWKLYRKYSQARSQYILSDQREAAQAAEREEENYYEQWKSQTTKREMLSKQKLAVMEQDLKLLKDWPADCAEFFFSGLPVAIANCQCDADGKFELELNRTNHYVILAKAERHVPTQDQERYHWALKVCLNGSAKEKMLLSNDTLLESKPSDCPIRLIDLDPEKEGWKAERIKSWLFRAEQNDPEAQHKLG